MLLSLTRAGVISMKVGMLPLRFQQGMQLNGSLAMGPGSPWEQGQTEVDGGRVQSVDGLLQFQTEFLMSIKLTRVPNENLGEVGIDAPASCLVGMRQSIAR